MALVCSVLGHSAAASTVSNQGYQFSTCTRCGVDLIQSGEGQWIAPPKGYRIVRRKRPPLQRAEEAAPPPETVSDLPMKTKDKRKSEDRRVGREDTRPASLRNVERRRADRREGSGNYRANRRRGLVAE